MDVMDFVHQKSIDFVIASDLRVYESLQTTDPAPTVWAGEQSALPVSQNGFCLRMSAQTYIVLRLFFSWNPNPL